MIQRTLLMMTLLLGFFGLNSCAQATATPDPSQLATAVSATLESSSSPTPAAPTATATAPAPETTLWMSYDSGGDQIWVLGDGLPYQRQLPVSVGEFYGYAPATNRILMAAHWGDHGAGPGNVSVSDLSILDLDTGLVTTLISDNVVEALWSPDGEAIAYILATPATYELHWRGRDGSDRTLAENVTFTWSISPSGETIAFTRESGYEITIDPGFYAVRVDSGDEVKLSDLDKSGTGSTADFPFWSFDASQVILSHYGGPGEARLVWARGDGTESRELGLLTDTGQERRDLALPFLLWDPDGEHLYAASGEYGGGGGMGGPSPLVRYRLERTDYTLVEPETIGSFHQVIGWAVPGYSLWVWDDSGIRELVLP
jgi:hypothetical protein